MAVPSRTAGKNSRRKSRKAAKAAAIQKARQARTDHDTRKATDGRLTEALPKEEIDLSSSITAVRDLGFSAAPFPSLHPLLTADSMEDVMDVGRLRDYFQLQPETETSVEKTMHTKIKQSLQSNSDAPNYLSKYLPIDAFEVIFALDPIKALVKEKYPQASAAQCRAKVNQLMGRRRILAILLYMEKFELVETFIHDNILDGHLPLRFQDSTFWTRDSDQKNTALLQNWDSNALVLFEVHQSVFLAPFFAIQDDPHYYIFDQSIRLPWLRSPEIKKGSKISQVEIHPGHHNFKSDQGPDKPLSFALKEFSPGTTDTFRQELLALKKACVLMHKEKHLIRLLLAFQHGEKHYFLFEWANGDLEGYWEKHPEPPQHTAAKATWAVQQCLGLATAVKRIHGIATWQIQARQESVPPSDGGDDDAANEPVRDWGRHGDIKPQNILWFPTYDTDTDLLVLSDLGLTRYHSSVTRSLVVQVDGYTSRYRAPEVDLPGQRISQKYDIWSLGCVFLEFCIWWLEGYEAVKKFEDDRWRQGRWSLVIMQEDNYYVVKESNGRSDARLKPVVLKWIRRLRQEHATDVFAQAILDLVEHHMLVVDKTVRSSIDLVCTELTTTAKLLQEQEANSVKQPLARAANDVGAPSQKSSLRNGDGPKPRYPLRHQR